MKLRLFVVALLIAIIAIPAQAQGRRGRPNEQLGIAIDNVHHTFEVASGGLYQYDPYRFGGGQYRYPGYRGQDYAYGYGYQNNRYGRNRHSYSQPATQRDVRGWGIGQIAATAVIGGIVIHKVTQIDKKLRQPAPQGDVRAVPEEHLNVVIMVNASGCDLRINGALLRNGQSLQVADPARAVFDTRCPSKKLNFHDQGPITTITCQ